MSPSYGMITEPLSDLSLGTRLLGHLRSLLKSTFSNPRAESATAVTVHIVYFVQYIFPHNRTSSDLS